jgi:hypothetical protein
MVGRIVDLLGRIPMMRNFLELPFSWCFAVARKNLAFVFAAWGLLKGA